MKTIRFALVVLLGLGAAACSNDSKSDEPAPAAKKPAPPPAAPSAADVAAAVDAVMAPYEACRALLAADKAEGIAECAASIATAASAGEASISDAAKPHMASIASAATALAAVPEDDLASARLAYGEVSKSVVAMLTATPAAATKYHVFECPMAAGYKRWAQPDAQLANPYMGTQMLACGSEVHDHHAAGGM